MRCRQRAERTSCLAQMSVRMRLPSFSARAGKASYSSEATSRPWWWLRTQPSKVARPPASGARTSAISERGSMGVAVSLNMGSENIIF